MALPMTVAVRSDPPRPRVVISPSGDCPKNPVTTATLQTAIQWNGMGNGMNNVFQC